MSWSSRIREEIITNVISIPDLEYNISRISSIDDEDNTKISGYDTKLSVKLNTICANILDNHNNIKYDNINMNSSFEIACNDNTQDDDFSPDSNKDRKLSTKLNIKTSSLNTLVSHSIEKSKALYNDIDELHKEVIQSNDEK